MKNALIINAHHYYPFSEGKLNSTLVDKASSHLQAQGYNLKTTVIDENYNVETELEKHQWADIIVVQAPVNWMGMPWPFKKYMDEVYTAGMAGQLCNGDGRGSDNPKENYGTGGTLTGKRYMLSLTFNAPEQAFNNNSEFFEGKSVDDLFFPMHLNFKFFGMAPLPTFVAYDVMKNPDVENDLTRFESHLAKHL